MGAVINVEALYHVTQLQFWLESAIWDFNYAMEFFGTGSHEMAMEQQYEDLLRSINLFVAEGAILHKLIEKKGLKMHVSREDIIEYFAQNTGWE